MKGALGSKQAGPRVVSGLDQALLNAEKAVRRKIWLRKTLPLNLLFLLPGLAFIGTKSKLVLLVFVAATPLVFILRAVLAQVLSSWIGPEEQLLREEIDRLKARSDKRSLPSVRRDL